MVSFALSSGTNFSVRNVVLSMIGLIVSSKTCLPLYPVPVTLQMLAVYYLGMILTPKESFSAVLGWLTLGAIGFPVFASPFGGIGGVTTGYLMGMLLGAPFVGVILKKGFSPIVACFSCYIVVHLFGCTWLSNFVGWSNVIQFGVVPFLIPEIFKITCACGIFCKKIS